MALETKETSGLVLEQKKSMIDQKLMKRILVIDDELDSNLTLQSVLEHNGFKVDIFADHILALKNFKANLYSLLIVDTNMSKKRRWQLYNGIKKMDDKVRVCFLGTSQSDI
jgi:DNA-binding response OmpR family regulator